MDTLTSLPPSQLLAATLGLIVLGIILRIRRRIKLRAQRQAPEPAAAPSAKAPPAGASDQPQDQADPKDLSQLGVYAPHFDFTDSDAFKAAIRDVRAAEASLASAGAIVIAQGEAPPADTASLVALAARAFTTDADGAISNVRWDTIAQMETRIAQTQTQIDARLAPSALALNPEFVALKLQELRLTHEQRERANSERSLRQELARIQKTEQKLARDIVQTEREEAKLQAQLSKAKAAAQRASGDQAFELEGKVGALTRQLEQVHAKLSTAQTTARNTTAGHVYVLSNVGTFGDGIVKIGMTRRAVPEDEVTELGIAAVPFPYDIHAMIYSDDAEELRDALWRKFGDVRLNTTHPNGAGFFKTSLQQVAVALKDLAPGAAFTTDIEAREHRASQNK